jgi:hypothetical protein
MCWNQSIKYGGGPPEIREYLTLTSEIVALIESQQKLLADLDKRNQQRSISIGQLHKFLSAGHLAPLTAESVKLVGDFKDLVRREQEMKERFTRDILRSESESRKS